MSRIAFRAWRLPNSTAPRAERVPRLRTLVARVGRSVAERHVAWLVVLGMALRAWHYLRDPSIWTDEANLILNVLGKSFGELLGPLSFAEAGPPLFLWIEKAVSLTLGDGLYALRFVPFAASCASMVLMPYIARRVVRPAAVGWVVLLFAVSDRLLHHACEAKQYAVECLTATILLSLYVGMRSWPLRRQLLIYAALAPVLICLSYPACFLYGGLLVALLPAVWEEGKRSNSNSVAATVPGWRMPCGELTAYGLLTLSVAGSFLLVYLGPIRAQRCPEIVQYWIGVRAFADWGRLWTVPLWSMTATLNMVDYFCRPVGHVLAPLALVGLVAMWRRSGAALVVLLALPIALAYAASLGAAYPYGGWRVMVYALPSVVLLLAEGVPSTLAWLERRGRWSRTALVLLLLAPAAKSLWRVAAPWRRADSQGAAQFVLAHRRPTDAITGNVFDYAYIFRRVPEFAPLWVDPQFRQSSAQRTWVLITAATPAERDLLIRRGMPADRRTVAQYEFEKTTVYLMEPAARTADERSAPSRPVAR